MHYTKSILIAILGLGAMAFAAPVENAVAAPLAEGATLDSCNKGNRRQRRECERARDEKHDGRKEIEKGEREILDGKIEKGLKDIQRGLKDQLQGRKKECYAGGRC